jgi:hypothetical protein
VQEQELSAQLQYQEQSVVAMKALSSAGMHAYLHETALTSIDTSRSSNITTAAVDAAITQAAYEAELLLEDITAQLADELDGFTIARSVASIIHHWIDNKLCILCYVAYCA